MPDYQKRIADYDSIPKEFIQVFIIRHIINMVVKVHSPSQAARRDALCSAQLLSVLALHIMDKRQVYYNQFDKVLRECCIFIRGDYEQVDKQPWVVLFNQYTKGEMGKFQMEQTDDYSRSNFPIELVERLNKIDR